jgi:fatty acid desaturase
MIASPPDSAADYSAQLRLTEHTAAYARLKAEIKGAGILQRSYFFYLPLILTSFGGYALSTWAVVAWDAYPSLLFACLGFTFFTVQLAGLMHDAGHRAVFSSIRLNNLLGLATTAAIGMVFANWKERHNQHHAHPNQEGADPDMEIPFLALSWKDYCAKDAAQRLVSRWQAYYYYPLGALVGFSNRLGSISYFLRNRTRANLARFAFYLPGMFFLFAGPFIAFPLEKAIFVFLVVHVTTGIYLASCFAPNHKGMRTFPPNASVSFLQQQVETSRNVRGGWLTDILLVGLNHQIEHHLFPSCPRNKLRLLNQYVKRVCAEQEIDFCEVSFLRTNQTLVKHLHDVARHRGLARGEQPSIAATAERHGV